MNIIAKLLNSINTMFQTKEQRLLELEAEHFEREMRIAKRKEFQEASRAFQFNLKNHTDTNPINDDLNNPFQEAA